MGKRKTVEVVDLTLNSGDEQVAGPGRPAKARRGGIAGGSRRGAGGGGGAKAGNKKAAGKGAEKRQDASGSTVRWAAQPNQQIKDRIERALAVGSGASHRMYLLERQTLEGVGAQGGGAEEFVVQGATGNVYTVCLCRQPSCTCPDFLKRGTSCKHILFVLLRVCGLPRDDPLVWQRAYLSSEVDDILGGLRRAGGRAADTRAVASPEVRDRYRRLSGAAAGPSGAGGSSQERLVEGECVICFEELVAGGTGPNKVTSCHSCHNHLHADCMSRWLQQRRASGTAATCPYCRAAWEGEDNRAAGTSGAAGRYINLNPQGQAVPSLETLYGARSVWVRANQGEMSRGEAAAVWNAMGGQYGGF